MKSLIKLVIFIILCSLFLHISFGDRIIAEMSITYKLTGEITNTNPYSVFIAVPSNITFEEKTLPKPEDFLNVNINKKNGESIPSSNSNTTFNGKIGFWAPPYTTVKVVIYNYNPIVYDITVDDSKNSYDVVGPAVVNKVNVIDLKKIFHDTKYKGIKIGKFKLYVNGYIVKGNDTESLSIIIPTPLVIDEYNDFHKILGKRDANIWIPSYNIWYRNQMKRKNINVDIDDPLIPKMDDSLLLDDGINSNFKILDIPAMAFTTSSDEPIKFYYIIYKYNN